MSVKSPDSALLTPGLMFAVVLMWPMIGTAENAGAVDSRSTAPEVLDQGQELFGRSCQQCHSSRGIGGKCPTLVRGAWAPGGSNSDQFMFDIISNGRPGTQMGAFAGVLSADEIWKIISYLRYESARIQVDDARAGADEEEDRR